MSKKFRTSIEFWHNTGGGLSEETIRELEEHNYHIKRNGVSNYTLDQKVEGYLCWKDTGSYRRHQKFKRHPKLETHVLLYSENDHTCRFMGFGQTKQEQKRVDAIKRKYGGFADGE